ncbi:Post-transcriptional regulator ComN [compost metagenome]
MSDEILTDEELDQAIIGLCQSKAEEFRLIGYEYITADEVWECVSSKYKKQQLPRTHQLVNDILSLKATQIMNYLTLSVYRGNPI